jgi:hypothetical protein
MKIENVLALGPKALVLAEPVAESIVVVGRLVETAKRPRVIVARTDVEAPETGARR